MKRLSTLALLAVLTLTGSAPAFARQMSAKDYERQSRKAAKQHQTELKKALKKQRKATKKYQKEQQKAARKANEELMKKRAREFRFVTN